MHALTACRSCFNFLDNIISCPVWDHESNFSVSYSSEYFSAGTTLVRDNFGELTIGLRFYLLSPKVLCIQLFIINHILSFFFSFLLWNIFLFSQDIKPWALLVKIPHLYCTLLAFSKAPLATIGLFTVLGDCAIAAQSSKTLINIIATLYITIFTNANVASFGGVLQPCL